MKRSTRITLISSIVIVALLSTLLFMQQKSDSATIKTAQEVDAFITQYCEATDRVPSLGALLARFPYLNKASDWVFFTDARTYFKMQYPVKWWNKQAIGVPSAYKFAAIPYAYIVEHHCGQAK